MGVSAAVVEDGQGRVWPLGDFVFRLAKESGESVSELARRSGLSRSFLYLLKDDRQVPSIDSLVALFEAAGAEEVRVPEPGERGDLVVRIRGEDHRVSLPDAGKRAARSRSAIRSLNAGTTSGAAYASLDSGPPPDITRAMASPSARAWSPAGPGGDWAGAAPTPPDERKRLLGALLESAAGLDAERLALLVEHARLLGRP
jgi:transcriptional regulator with XRE-family HTH domain